MVSLMMSKKYEYKIAIVVSDSPSTSLFQRHPMLVNYEVSTENFLAPCSEK